MIDKEEDSDYARYYYSIGYGHLMCHIIDVSVCNILYLLLAITNNMVFDFLTGPGVWEDQATVDRAPCPG
jgi:hypothetical protein